MKLTKNTIKYKTAATAIILALFVLGFYGFMRLSVDFLPNMTYPLIRVNIWWKGATPGEIEKNIADPIERQISTIDDLDFMESSSTEGRYSLAINFNYGIDVNVAYQDVLAAVNRVTSRLPDDIEPPVIVKMDPSQLPVLQLTVKSKELNLIKLRSWVDEWLQYQIISVSGVAGAEITGGLTREIRILIDSQMLEKYNISVNQISKRLQEENIEQFAGRVTIGKKEIIARTSAEYKSVKDIESVVILNANNSNILLKDIAKVEDSNEEVRIITRVNQEPCIKLSILKQATANTVAVSESVEKKINELKKSFPGDVEIGIVENQADYVKSALNGVTSSAWEAAILLVIIIFLFLGSFRQVVIMVLSLPVTLVLNFGLMKLAGFSLNIFSLGGLVIAIGVLLDNSIIVIENITRRKKDFPDENMDKTAEEATNEVVTPIIAGTLSFVTLFLPFLLIQGLTTLLFRELILVIAGVVLISLFVAITITPMLSSLLLRTKKDYIKKETIFEKFFIKFTNGYGKILEYTLNYKWVTIAFFVSLLAISFMVANSLGTEFLPPMDDGRINIKVRLATGTSINVTDKAVKEVESKIKNDKLIKSYFTVVGGKIWGASTFETSNEGEINIELVPKTNREITTKEYVKKIQAIINKIDIPDAKIMVSPSRIKGIKKMGDSDIEIKIKGSDVNGLFNEAQKLSNVMNKLKYFKNIYISMDMTKPEYKILIDRTKAYSLSVSAKTISETVNGLITGTISAKFRDNNEYHNIRILIPEKNMVSKNDIENLTIQTSSGKQIKISDVALVVPSMGPVELSRYNQIKQIIVRGDADGVSVGQALSELKEEMAKFSLEPGYDIDYSGQAQMMAEMKISIISVLVFAIFFSFIMLVVQFNAIKLPAIIFMSVPFCFSGLLLILFYTNASIGATVIIGLLIVVSATINDGVLLLTFAEELQIEKKLSPFDAVLNAAKIRLRPRIMTTVSTIIGFIPLAFSFEDGGDMLQPMAMAAIGGLSTEIFVALFMMPSLYIIIQRNPKKNIATE